MKRPRAAAAPAPAAARAAASAWALALVLAAAPALPERAAAFTVTGRVLKGEARQPTAGVPVSLHIVDGTEERPGKTATSGPGGEFRFEGLVEDPKLSYFLATEYEGAFYTEGPLEVDEKDRLSRDLVIYEVGRDLTAVRVVNHHIVVERNPDHLHVTEILVFENRAHTAYLGTGLNHAENAGVRVGLPASVKEFQTGVGGDAQTVRVQGRDLASFRPIPPGTRPFSFSYHVPLSGRMDLSHRLYFPTDKFVVLIGTPELRVESRSLEYAGPKEQGGRKFELYQGSNFPVGAEVPMRVQGASFWSNPKLYPWLAAPFLVVAVLVFAARRGRAPRTTRQEGALRAAEEPQPFAPPAGTSSIARPRLPESPDGDDFATVYLYLIDALDRGLERGEFSKESHALIRGNLKRRLETILSDRPRSASR